MIEGADECNMAGVSRQRTAVTNQSQQLYQLKQQVNQQSDKITGAQKEIEMMRAMLSDARRRLERMKRTNVHK